MYLYVTARVNKGKRLQEYNQFVGKAIQLVMRVGKWEKPETYYYDEADQLTRVFIHVWSLPGERSLREAMEALQKDHDFEAIYSRLHATVELEIQHLMEEQKITEMAPEVVDTQRYLIVTYRVRPLNFSLFETKVLEAYVRTPKAQRPKFKIAYVNITGVLGTCIMWFQIENDSQVKSLEIYDPRNEIADRPIYQEVTRYDPLNPP